LKEVIEENIFFKEKRKRSSFTDQRGKIEDLLLFDTPMIDSITRIHSVKGAVRGNHYHKQTEQWTYIVKGKTRVVSDGCKNHLHDIIASDGMLLYHPAGMAHAFEAVEDTEWLVFTKGPRSGDNYESDTFRLETPLI